MFEVNKLIQLKDKERIVVVLREYSITKIPQLAIVTCAYFATLFFLYPLFNLGWWGVILFAVLFGAIMTYSVRVLVVWLTDVVIVTNQRLIDHQRHGIFSKTVREITWSQVTDIQYSQRGLWATICHYGAIKVVLTSADSMGLQHVYQPDRIRDILAEYVPTLS